MKSYQLHLLQDDKSIVCFLLHCRKFIDLVGSKLHNDSHARLEERLLLLTAENQAHKQNEEKLNEILVHHKNKKLHACGAEQLIKSRFKVEGFPTFLVFLV